MRKDTTQSCDRMSHPSSATGARAKDIADDEDDAWMGDAPKQDYLDPDVNSYRHLADDQQPWFKAKQRMGKDEDDDLDNMIKRTFSLRVRNLPVGIDENGLFNLFSKHGRVLDVTIFRIHPAWAKVTFSDHLEAQTARKSLDGSPPFNLAITTLSERQKGRGKEEEEVVEEFKEWKNYAQMSKQQLGASGKQSLEKVEEKAETAKTDDEHQRQKDCYSTKPKVFGSEVMVPYAAPGPCSNKDCTVPGRFRCARCKTWYCSQNCQIQHWFKHKLECTAPPPLESPEGSVVSVALRGEEISLKKEFRKKLRNTPPKMTKVKDESAAQSPSLFPSALLSLRVGYISQLYAPDAEALNFSTSSFLAVCCDKDSAFDYIFGDMQEDMEAMLRDGNLPPATEVAPGALVLAKNQEEEYGRCIILATRGSKVKVFNVDVGTKEWCDKISLFSPPESVFSTSKPFLIVRLTIKDGGDPISLKVFEESLKVNPMFDITVLKAEEEKLSVIVSVEGEGELGEYEVLPWTATDPLVEALF